MSAFQFVGAYACIRGDLSGGLIRSAAQDLVDIASLQPWRSMYYAKQIGPQREIRYSGDELQRVLSLIESRSLETLGLLALPPGKNPEWWRAYADWSSFSCTLNFDFPHAPMGRLSDVGPSSNFILTFPTRLFGERSQTDSSRLLLDRFAKVFVERNLSYCFLHLGQRESRPLSIGVDDIFYQTKDSLPISAFEFDILSESYNLYGEYVRSAFWANFLNPSHVERLGGVEAIKALKLHEVTPLVNGGALVVATASPLDRSSEAREAYQLLRNFLKPIRAEPSDENAEAIARLKGLR